MIKVGIPSYLNALPYRMALENEKGISLFCDVPTKINEMFKRNELDIALISSVEALNPAYHHFPYGIAAENEVLSVNLYVKEEISSLDNAAIGLTSESATSVALLKVLCHHHWKVKPHFKPLGDARDVDGFLLIGDKALCQQKIAGHRRIDLASSWYEMCSLPFLFAVFAAKKNYSLQFPEMEREKVLQRATLESNLSFPLLDRYYSLIRYRLSEREFHSLAHFDKLRRAL